MAYVILFFVAPIDLLTVSKLSNKEEMIGTRKKFRKGIDKVCSMWYNSKCQGELLSDKDKFNL